MPDFTKQTTLQVNSYTLYCRNYAFYLIKSYLYSSTLSNHPFDQPNFIPLVGSGWLSGSKGTSGVRDIAYTIFRFQHSTNLQLQFVMYFPTPLKATGQTMSSITVARCLTMYGINVSCYTAILPTFPSRQF